MSRRLSALAAAALLAVAPAAGAQFRAIAMIGAQHQRQTYWCETDAPPKPEPEPEPTTI
jgi:hypothetical protein